MKKLGILALALSLTLGSLPNKVEARNVAEKAAVTVHKSSNKILIERLRQIKEIVTRGNLTAMQRSDLKRETLDIKKQIQQNDPTLVISLSAALLVALILILLVRPHHTDTVVVG